MSTNPSAMPKLSTAQVQRAGQPLMRLRGGRLIVLAALVLITSVFGFVDLAEGLGIPGVIAPHDLGALLAMAFVAFALFVGEKRIRYVLLRGNLSRLVGCILALVAITTISMPFRGDVKILEAIRLARWFFPWFIFFVIARDVRDIRDVTFYNRLVMTIAVMYSAAAIVYASFPAFGEMIYKGIALRTYDDSWGMGVDRHVLKGNNGILFIHLGFVLSAHKLLKGGRRNDLALFFLCTTGMFLQGWRAVMIGAMIAVLVTGVRLSRRELTRSATIGASLIAIASVVDLFIVKGIVRAKIFSAAESVFTGGGAIGARWARDQIYMIPMFQKQPWFGWGFINKNSRMAADVGLMDSNVNKTFTIYNFDSGWLTLLNMFGIVGVTVFMVAVILLMLRARKSYRQLCITESFACQELRDWSGAVVAFGIMLILAQHTFGGLMTPIGILPFAVLCGVVQGLIFMNTNATSPARSLLFDRGNNSYINRIA